MNVEILALGAHPDDVELGIGGLIRKFASRGQSVGILDLTRGEMGSRGSVEERATEAADAAAILGVTHRANAGLPDGGLRDTQEQRMEVVRWLRRFRPQVLFAPMRDDRHPDHHTAHFLAREANYLAGLAKIATDAAPWRAPKIYFYHPYTEETMPALLVDISDQFECKCEALRAHRSQFFNPAYEGRATFISSPEFWESIATRAAYWGGRAGVRYAEALYAPGPVACDLPPM